MSRAAGGGDEPREVCGVNGELENAGPSYGATSTQFSRLTPRARGRHSVMFNLVGPRAFSLHTAIWKYG